jgi:hypothetical protein
MTGAKGSRYCDLLVSATEPMVRPWKQLEKARNSAGGASVSGFATRWNLRENLIAASLASVPELAKKARSAKDASTSRLARATCAPTERKSKVSDRELREEGESEAAGQRGQCVEHVVCGGGVGRGTHLRPGVLDVAGMDEGGGLAREGGGHVGVGVSERGDGDAGGHVEVLAAVEVVELAPAAAVDDDAGAVVGAHEVPRLVLDNRQARR